MESGIIFDIQSLSIHDGPGIRTTVFFKGCPLRCLWCANPESQNFKSEIMLDLEKCTNCLDCYKICPTKAAFTRNDCIGCGQCVEICTNDARKLVGKTMTSEEIFDEIIKDKVIYEHSNGGVTFSGGEVLSQPDLLEEVLKKCKENGLHTVIDTTAYCKNDIFRRILKYVDLVYVDLKCIDDIKHVAFTGVSNQIILKNIKYMDDIGQKFDIRMPIIPSLNNDKEMIESAIRFILSLNSKPTVWLLPFHSYGKSKYEKLGMKWTLSNMNNMNREEVIPIQALMKEHGIDAKIQ